MEAHVNVAIFSLLMMANLAMGGLLAAYHQQRPDHQLNILVLLQSYLTNVLPAINLTLILPLLVRLAFGPVGHVTAELAVMLLYVLVCLLIILTVASSLVKLVLVANYGLVFALDPVQLGRLVLGLAASAALLPNLAFTAWVLAACGCYSNATVAYLEGAPSQQKNQMELVNFATTILMLWLLLSLVLVMLVVFGIPAYLKRVHTSLAIRN
jgi:hypothetical protein